MAITELLGNELPVTHAPALGRDFMMEGDVTGHPVHPLLRPLFPGGDRVRRSTASTAHRTWAWGCSSMDGVELSGYRSCEVLRCDGGGLTRHDWSWFRAPVVGWPPSPLSWKNWTWSMPVHRPSCRFRSLAGLPPGSGLVGPPWLSAGDGPVRSHTLMCAPSDGGNRNRQVIPQRFMRWR